MGYIARILGENERIRYRGKLHWSIYLPAILALVLAVAVAAFAPTLREGSAAVYWAAIILAGAAVVLAGRAWFEQWITQIVVTDRRVIYKRGFIRRHSAEMNMDKIESVIIDQSILGRILDYGTVHIRGVGVGIEQLRRIDSPLDLRNAIVPR